jgi:hypothetical protein
MCFKIGSLPIYPSIKTLLEPKTTSFSAGLKANNRGSIAKCTKVSTIYPRKAVKNVLNPHSTKNSIRKTE